MFYKLIQTFNFSLLACVIVAYVLKFLEMQLKKFSLLWSALRATMQNFKILLKVQIVANIFKHKINYLGRIYVPILTIPLLVSNLISRKKNWNLKKAHLGIRTIAESAETTLDRTFNFIKNNERQKYFNQFSIFFYF